MSAPLAGPEGGGPLRPVPRLVRLLFADEEDLFMGAALLLGVPATLGAVVSLCRGRWVGVFPLILVAVGALAVLRWRVGLLRRALAHGVEVRARVTHLARFAAKDDPGDEAWRGFTQVVAPVLRWGAETGLVVVYPWSGGERQEHYRIKDGVLRRTRPVVGGEVVLIVHPALSKPLLRDAYLDP